jgi:hypothetical protein
LKTIGGTLIRRPRRRAVITALFGLALLAGGATSVAFATGDTFVYDAVIDETVPAALDAALQGAIGNPNSPTGDGGIAVDPPAAEAPPPVDTGTLTPVNTTTGVAPPFGIGVQRPVNMYSSNDSLTERDVYAGADGSASSSGSIIDSSVSLSDGSEQAGKTTLAPYTGALTITAFSDTSLTMRGSNTGYTVTYDLSTRTAQETCPRNAPCGFPQ